jgi:hypothetical protein
MLPYAHPEFPVDIFRLLTMQWTPGLGGVGKTRLQIVFSVEATDAELAAADAGAVVKGAIVVDEGTVIVDDGVAVAEAGVVVGVVPVEPAIDADDALGTDSEVCALPPPAHPTKEATTTAVAVAAPTLASILAPLS